MYEAVRTLPWAKIGELVAGLRLSPRGDWLECTLDDGPFGILAWPAQGAIRIRALHRMQMSYLRKSVARVPNPSAPPVIAPGSEANELWRIWLNDNVVVEPAHLNGPSLVEDEEPYWLAGVGHLAHLAFVMKATRDGAKQKE